MAILTTKTTLSSSDFFSKKLDIDTNNSVATSGDDRVYGTDRVALGVRATATITQADSAAANINNDSIILVDADNNSHTITYSNTYSYLSAGKGSEGALTLTSYDLPTWDGKTIIMADNEATVRTLTLTIDKDVSATTKTSTSSTAIAYTVGISGLTTTKQIRSRITSAIETVRKANLISIRATDSVTNDAMIELDQLVPGTGGNVTITGTSEGSTTTNTDFTKGGIGYTSSFAGTAGNAETTAAHASSLYNSINLAYSEGKINMSPSLSGSVITLTMTGPYTPDNSIAIQGSAVRGGEVTTTVFSGSAVPQALSATRINSKYEKAYLYAVNLSSKGTVNIYTKESTAKVEGRVSSSHAQLDGGGGSSINIDNDAGKTILLTSAEGNVYTLTSVASGADTANTRTGDTTADYVIATTMEETLENLSVTLKALDNKAARETEPFVLEIDEDEKIGKIKHTKIDAGTPGNTSITGTFIDVSGITGTAFTGGTDAYHLLARLGPGEHLYMPTAGSPLFYADAETTPSELEYLILES